MDSDSNRPRKEALQPGVKGVASAEHGQQSKELELRRFQLAILSQATQDMITLREPEALLESFLLTTMGAVGAVMGFNVVLPPFSHAEANTPAPPDGAQSADAEGGQPPQTNSCASLTPHLASRGLEEHQRQRLLRNLDSVAKALPAPPKDACQDSSQIVIRDTPAGNAAFPAQTSLVLGWRAPSGRSGFFGLGARLNQKPYDNETTGFVQSLLHLFTQALENACSSRTINALNQELLRNNNALHQALRQARDSQANLDKRVFQLHTLYDAAMELSPLQEPSEIMDTFLLLLMGALGIESCALLLHDTAEDVFRLAHRGPATVPELSTKQMKDLLFACIGGSTFRELKPLSVQSLSPESIKAAPSLMEHPSRLMLLRVDEQCLGLLVLGKRIMDQPLGEQEDEVLASLVHNAMLLLRNARSFATIQTLNRDLEARNKELVRTLEELTASRSHIEVLERAGAKLRTMLRHHAERIGRVSPWDFIWILLASAMLGLFFNTNNPNGVKLLPSSAMASTERLSPRQARELLREDSEAVLLDARPVTFYEQEHATGSLNMPPSLFDFVYSMRFGASVADPPCIVYGRSISRLYDEEIAQRLQSQGHGRVFILEGGLEAWKNNGGAVEQGG